MWIGIVTLFPEMFNAITDYGIVGKAVKNGLLSIKFWNPRFFTSSFYKNIDDYPYGGGGGMLMKAEPLKSAIDHAKKDGGLDTKVIYMSPQGKRLNQKFVYNLSKSSKLILVCGRYSGIDERLIRTEIDEEWSIGDYIISGGELAAMVLIDAISRLIPGVLNNSKSSLLDSFVAGRLNFPNYTRPRVFKGIQVPSVLLTGNHKDIARWRLKQSLGQTWIKRPDLLKNLKLTQEEKMLLLEFKDEYCSKE